MADRMFSAQQDEEGLPVGASWDHYFPFNATNVRADENYATSFVALMRLSFHRPRDILTILDILREKYDDPPGNRVFEYKDLFTAEFKRTYGDYLLGEIKDSLSFYYDEEEFELFLKFFEYLDGKQKFTYEKYIEAFERLTLFLEVQQKLKPGFMRTAEEFLQFLYDQNILSYVEHTTDERLIRWCFIERSPSNISPKVKAGLEYEIHYGLANVLNTGKEITSTGRNVLANVESAQEARRKGRGRKGARSSVETGRQQLGAARPDARQTSAAVEVVGVKEEARLLEASSPSALEVGIVKFYYAVKGYGFIIKDNTKEDIHFSCAALEGTTTIRRGTRVEFVITRDSGGRLTAIDVRRRVQRRGLE